jgi:serine protease Do
LTENQGCYLFQNHLGVELTITFTSQDGGWNQTIKVPGNGEYAYCLAPGRYTYTIDAPPPWASISDELVVNAGDRYRWPISGGE